MAHSFEEEAREHLLSIPDDSNGSARAISKASAHVSVQNLVEPKNRILKGISVEIKAGQVYCIIGPSGSGKSTFLRAINRLWEPPTGTIFLNGEDIVKMNVLAIRRRIGMLFQSPMLFDGCKSSIYEIVVSHQSSDKDPEANTKANTSGHHCEGYEGNHAASAQTQFPYRRGAAQKRRSIMEEMIIEDSFYLWRPRLQRSDVCLDIEDVSRNIVRTSWWHYFMII